MNLTTLQQLIQALDRSAIATLEIDSPGCRLRLQKSAAQAASVPAALVPATPQGVRQPPPDPHAAQPRAAEMPALVTARAPLAGCFASCHPWQPQPLVRPGQRVRAGDLLGLLRIGLLYAPVPAPIDGTVLELLADDGQPLGYGSAVATLMPIPSTPEDHAP